jgi:hypothetical protein
VNRGRKAAMLIAALAIVPTALAPSATSLWVTIGTSDCIPAFRRLTFRC